MPESTQPALVLDDDSVSHDEPVHFGGFPGLWAKDRPVLVSELGFETLDDAYQAVDELGLPLARTTVAAGEGLMPVDENRMPGLDEVRGTDWKPSPGQPGAELGPGEVFPPAPEGAAASAVQPVLAANAAEVIDAVAAVADVTALEAMRASETANKNRSTVLAAIDARVDELGATP